MEKGLKNGKRPLSDPGISRRQLIATGGLLTAGGIFAGSALAVTSETKAEFAVPPPLPWPWAPLEPQEAGERAFRTYHEKGG